MKSKYGVGSTFFFSVKFGLVPGVSHITLRQLGDNFARTIQSLPLPHSPPLGLTLTSSPPLLPSSPQHRRCLVYIADPNPVVRQSVRCYLEICGVEVRELTTLEDIDIMLDETSDVDEDDSDVTGSDNGEPPEPMRSAEGGAERVVEGQVCVLLNGYPRAKTEVRHRKSDRLMWVDMVTSDEGLESHGMTRVESRMARIDSTMPRTESNGLMRVASKGKEVMPDEEQVGNDKDTKDLTIWKPCGFNKVCSSLATLLGVEIPAEFYQHGLLKKPSIPVSEEEKKQYPYKIMVVEDNLVNYKVFSRFLEDAGFLYRIILF